MLYYKTCFFLLATLLLSSFNAQAQRTTIPGTNVTFELPANWVAENVDGQLFIASAEEEGFILLSASQMADGESLASLQTKKIEESGIVLTPTNYQLIESNRAAVDYTGDMFGIAMEGYAQMGTAETNDWAALALFFCEKGALAERHKMAVQYMITSMDFPTVSTAVNNNNSATTHTTYAASDYTPMHGAKLYYSGGDGNSETVKNIHLCPNGSFTRTGYSNTNYGGMGYSEMDLSAYGRWEAILLQGNSYKIILYWSDGDQSEFIIVPDGNGWFVNNVRAWFIDTNAARCN